MGLVLGCVCAFALGSVPFALLLVRALKGVDVRTIGSGNVGATNASRAFGSRGGRLAAFVMIYLLDAAKGFAPTWFGPSLVGGSPQLDGVLLGAAAILGHVFPPALRFRGGKGVATATGVLLALDWQVTALAIAVFFAVRWATGEVFLGSLALGVGLPAAAIALHPGAAFAARLPLTLLCCALTLFLFWTHRGNLRRRFAAARDGAR